MVRERLGVARRHVVYGQPAHAQAPAFREKLYYHDCDLYWYTIGREGQSIDPSVLKRHIADQIHATHLAIDGFDYEKLQAISPRLASCSMRYLSAMLTVSSIHLFQINTPESIEDNKSSGATFAKRSCAVPQASLHVGGSG